MELACERIAYAGAAASLRELGWTVVVGRRRLPSDKDSLSGISLLRHGYATGESGAKGERRAGQETVEGVMKLVMLMASALDYFENSGYESQESLPWMFTSYSFNNKLLVSPHLRALRRL